MKMKQRQTLRLKNRNLIFHLQKTQKHDIRLLTAANHLNRRYKVNSMPLQIAQYDKRALVDTIAIRSACQISKSPNFDHPPIVPHQRNARTGRSGSNSQWTRSARTQTSSATVLRRRQAVSRSIHDTPNDSKHSNWAVILKAVLSNAGHLESPHTYFRRVSPMAKTTAT